MVEFNQEKETHKILWDFEIQTDNPITARKSDLVFITKNQTCPLINFSISVDYKVKMKESEKISKLWDIKMTVIQILCSSILAGWIITFKHNENFSLTKKDKKWYSAQS